MPGDVFANPKAKIAPAMITPPTIHPSITVALLFCVSTVVLFYFHDIFFATRGHFFCVKIHCGEGGNFGHYMTSIPIGFSDALRFQKKLNRVSNPATSAFSTRSSPQFLLRKIVCTAERAGISRPTAAVQVSHFFGLGNPQKYGRTFSNPATSAFSTRSSPQFLLRKIVCTAERAGFEPARGFKAPTSLAVRRFRPAQPPLRTTHYSLFFCVRHRAHCSTF